MAPVLSTGRREAVAPRRTVVTVAGRFSAPAWLLLPALGVLAIAFLYPVAVILARSFTEPPAGLSHYRAFFAQSVYLTVLLHTLRLAGTVTGVCLLLGFPFAYAMTSAGRSARRLLLLALMLPLWTSLLVRTYAWLVLLDRNGLVNDALKSLGVVAQPLELVHNTIGVTVGMVHVLLPFMVLPLYSVMRNIDLRLVAAARSLGASPVRAFSTVYVPLVLPGVAAGCILVFIVSLGYYITPALLGGAQDTVLAQLIADEIGSLSDWGLGTAMAALLLLVTVALFVAFTRIVRLERVASV